MSLSAENLRCFSEAARLLNFGAAARAVALSPAALGQRIRQLESTLEVRLFHRTTRTVVLTRAGLDLLPHAQRAVTAVEACRRVSGGQVAPAPIELVLGTRHELGMSWIVPMLGPLERGIPGLTLHLYFGSSPDLTSRVRRVEIDCAVTSARLVDPMLDAEPLHEERYVFVGARTLLQRHPMRHADDARALTLFDTAEELPLFRYLSDAQGGLDSRAFSRVVRMGTIDAMRALVLRGAGVAVLPEHFIRRDLAARRLVKLLPQVKLLVDQFRLVFRRDDPRREIYASIAAIMRGMPLR